MSATPLDYGAIAKQYGAVSSSQPGVDYGAIAKQFGATDSQPAGQTQNQQEPDSFFGGVGQRLKDIATSQQPQTIGDALKNAPWFGPIPQALAGVAKNVKQLGPQVVQQAKQAATSHQPGDILPNLYDARTAVTAASMLDPFASGSVANVNQLQDQGRPREAAGQGLTDAALLAAGEGVGRGIPALRNALPDAERAGQAFKQVKAAAGNIPIDTTAPGNTALEIKRLAQSGGQMPKVVRDFITRATDPNQGPITFGEARDFYSNASRLSADEAQRLTPNMKRMAGQFRSDLGQSLQDAANKAGQGDAYSGAMNEYRRAMQFQDFQDMLKTGTVQAIKYGLGPVVGGTVLGKMLLNAMGKSSR